MLFGVVSEVGRGMGILDGDGYRQRGRGSFGAEFGASHCTNGILMCSCAEICEPIELSFREVSWVGCGMGVLDGAHVLQGEGAVSAPICFSGVGAYLCNRSVFDLYVKS